MENALKILQNRLRLISTFNSVQAVKIFKVCWLLFIYSIEKQTGKVFDQSMKKISCSALVFCLFDFSISSRFCGINKTIRRGGSCNRQRSCRGGSILVVMLWSVMLEAA